MIDDSRNRLTADAVLRSIHAEVGTRLQHQQPSCDGGPCRPATTTSPGTESAVSDCSKCRIEPRNRCHINELLRFHDVCFIANSYRTILHREADESGLQQYLEALRSGKLTKVEIIGHIRRSPEGRSRKVVVKGLWIPFIVQTAFRIPVLGYLFRFLAALARLPGLVKNLYGLDYHLHGELARLNEQLTDVAENSAQMVNDSYAELVQRQQDLIDQWSGFQQSMRTQVERLDAEKADRETVQSLWEHKADRNDLQPLWDLKADRGDLQPLWEQKADQKAVESLQATKADHGRVETMANSVKELALEMHHQKIALLDQQRRLRILLKEAQRRIPGEIGVAGEEIVIEERNHFLDSLYQSFEDRFRGTRDDIKQRLRIYLPYLFELKTESNGLQALDLGCGRGEWLEVMAEHNVAATGIDCNRVMVDECRERGLDAHEDDLFHHLESLCPAQLDLVTSFHVVEHLPLEDLIRLLDESRRVLKPGGILILETPNPENLLVGACSFYYDPTHRHPLPPPVLKYLAEARGFLDVLIHELHPVPEAERETLDDSQSARLLEKLLYGPRDYAVIARKA